jgi:hypothetical protein
MNRAIFDRIRSPMVRALFPGLLLTAAGVGAFVAVLDQVLAKDDLYFVDQPVLDGLARERTPWLTTVLTWVTNAFGPGILPILVGVACLAWWLATKRWRNPALLMGAMVTSTVIAFVVKAIAHRPRPAACR